MISEIEMAESLEPDEIEARCRVASEELRESLDTLEKHLQSGIAGANADGDFDLSGKLFGALCWVRMRRQQSHAERYVLKLAESV